MSTTDQIFCILIGGGLLASAWVILLYESNLLGDKTRRPVLKRVSLVAGLTACQFLCILAGAFFIYAGVVL